MTTYADRLERSEPPLETLKWDEFLAFLSDCWEPGQHIAIIGPTGQGKTTTAVGVLSTRKYVMVLDAKGRDGTLEAAGWVRVGHVPGERMGWRSEDRRKWNKIHQDIAEGRPARVIVGGAADSPEADTRLSELMFKAIQYARYAKGWTLYVDEFELTSSQRMLNLGRWIERTLITGRDSDLSVVTSYQAPAWVSKHASRQAVFAITFSTGDRDMIKNIARSMGRDWTELGEAVDELPKYFALVVPRGKQGGPMILIKAPRIN